MKLFDKLLEKIANKAADKAVDKVIHRIKVDRTPAIGFHNVEAQDLYEAQFHRIPNED